MATNARARGVRPRLATVLEWPKQEVTVVFAVAGLLLMVAGAAVSLARFDRLP